MLARILVATLALGVQAQTNRTIGEVQSVDAAGKRIELRADSGSNVTVTLDEKTLFLRVPPGERDLTKAAKITLGDISAGDRVLARGQTGEDGKSLAASAVIVMTKADLVQKQERERAEWQRRGAAGLVTAVNGNEIVVKQRAGSTLTVETEPKTQFRRYTPDSVRFADAKPGSLADIKTGDQVRVLGDKNEDGTRFRAEQVVSGAFRTLAGTVTGVDAAAGEMRIKDLESKKQISVRVTSDTSLKRLPPMIAERMARFREGAPAASGTPGRPASATGGFGGRGIEGPPDLGQMLERMPAVTLAELKSGDAVIVSSTVGTDPQKVTAIALVAGVEPLLAGGSQGPLGGAWNFDIGFAP